MSILAIIALHVYTAITAPEPPAVPAVSDPIIVTGTRG